MPKSILSAVVPIVGRLATAGLPQPFGIIAQIGFSLLGQALAPKPKTRGLPDFAVEERGISQIVRSSVEPHRIIYGERMASGPLVFVATSGTDNGNLHMVIPLAGHEVEAVGEIFFTDEAIGPLDAGGNVISGRFSGKATIKKHLGADDQAADSDLVSEVADWTTAHRLRGIAYLYAKLKYNRDVFPTGIPNVKALVKGRKVVDWRDAAIAVSSSSVANPTTITTAAAHGLGPGDRVFIFGHTGATPEIRGEHQVLTAPSSTTLTIDIDVTVAGAGGSLYEMRWSDNAALCIADYLVNDFGLGADPADELDQAAAVTAANICDEEVDLSASTPTFTFTADAATEVCTQDSPPENDKYEPLHPGDGVELTTTGTLPGGLSPSPTRYYAIPDSESTYRLATSLGLARAGVAVDIADAGSGAHTCTRKSQPRYTVNGVVKLDARPAEIIEGLLGAMFGTLTYTQGLYTMFAGAYTGPAAVTLNESNLRGEISVRPRPGKAELHNAVRGTLTDRDQLWQPTEFPSVTNATYEAADGGERIFKDIELRHVTESARAQRLAKLTNERDRQGLVCEFPANLTALELAVMDTVNLTIDQLGWSAKEFELVGWTLAEEGGVDLVLKETAAAVYAFDPDNDTTVVDLAPNTTLPSAFTVAAPTSLTLASGTAQLFVAGDGTVVSRLHASWTASDDIFVFGYEVQFKKSADSQWETAPLLSADEVATFIQPVDDGVDYDVRVRAVNQLGVRSAYLTVTGHTVVGKTAPPADVTEFSVQQNGNVATFKWGQVPDADLGGYELRYDDQGSFAWDSAKSITRTTRGTLVTNAVLEPGAHTVGVKAIDTTGNESINAKSFNITISNQNEIIVAQTEHPRWPGALTGFVRHDVSGRLAPDSNTLASAMTDAQLWDQFVYDPVASASYEAPEMDLGFDADNVRAFAEMSAGLGPGETGVADPELEIDYRDEAASYDGFEPWTIGAVDARRVKMRAKLTTANGVAYLAQFKPTLDVEERTEGAEGVTIAPTGTVITFTEQFHKKPNVQVTADGTGALFPIKSAVTATGFTAKVFDAAGNEVGGTVDWQATGA